MEATADRFASEDDDGELMSPWPKLATTENVAKWSKDLKIVRPPVREDPCIDLTHTLLYYNRGSNPCCFFPSGEEIDLKDDSIRTKNCEAVARCRLSGGCGGKSKSEEKDIVDDDHDEL